MKKLLFAVSCVVLSIAAVVAARTALLASKQVQADQAPEITLDRGKLLTRLSRAIQLQTISYPGSEQPHGDEFIRLHALLEQLFPRAHAVLQKEVVGDYSLLFTWRGSDNAIKPALIMGHMDVVPVERGTEADWTHAPFSGRIADGYVWGRGALDDKVSVLAALEAAEWLLQAGFRPRRTIYFAFGHDEEVGGLNGAARIAKLFQSRKVEFEYVLDEGGFVVQQPFPGMDAPVALIGTAEKGYLTLELRVESAGGHSSTPPPQTAIGILSSALHKLERSPFPTEIRGATRQMLQFLGPEMPWSKKAVLANLWLFGPLVRREMAKSPATDAMVRTTQAATIFAGGIKANVLPAKARAVVNFRILTGDTVASVKDRARRIIDDPRVTLTAGKPVVEPSAVSDVESPAFKLLQRTVRQLFPRTIAAPYLLVAATDSRHYASLTKNIFRFLPITLRPEDIRRLHGTDERIAVSEYERCVRFFIQLLRNTA